MPFALPARLDEDTIPIVLKRLGIALSGDAELHLHAGMPFRMADELSADMVHMAALAAGVSSTDARTISNEIGQRAVGRRRWRPTTMSWESEQFDAIKHQLTVIEQMLGAVLRGDKTIIGKEDTIMALQDDLNNAVTSLATGFGAEHTAVAAELVAIAAALAAPAPTPALVTAATQAVANISAITSQMATDAAALTASVPAATTVPPPTIVPPVVVVPPTVTPPVIATPPITAPTATPPSTPPASATTA
jgi:ActR/RegA family two-component response regulator